MATTQTSPRAVEEIIADWPAKSPGQQQHPKETARKMVEKYGVPDEMTPERLVWQDNGPWKRTEVYRDGPEHDFPVPHVDHLAQTIDYQVPLEKYDDLARFDGSIYPDRTKGELTAICHKEEANVLGLNLANDVITERKTVDEAREAYGKIAAKMMAGSSPDYTTAFQFQRPQGDQRDPDVTIVTEEAKQNAGRIALLGLALVGLAYFTMKRSRTESSSSQYRHGRIEQFRSGRTEAKR